MLSLAQARQVAPATLGVFNDVVQFLQHLLSLGSEQAQTIGTLQIIIRYVVPLAVTEIARAVTTIVTDIEGTLTFRGRRQRGQCTVGIDAIVAGREVAVAPDHIESRLRNHY